MENAIRVCRANGAAVLAVKSLLGESAPVWVRAKVHSSIRRPPEKMQAILADDAAERMK